MNNIFCPYCLQQIKFSKNVWCNSENHSFVYYSPTQFAISIIFNKERIINLGTNGNTYTIIENAVTAQLPPFDYCQSLDYLAKYLALSPFV